MTFTREVAGAKGNHDPQHGDRPRGVFPDAVAACRGDSSPASANSSRKRGFSRATDTIRITCASGRSGARLRTRTSEACAGSSCRFSTRIDAPSAAATWQRFHTAHTTRLLVAIRSLAQRRPEAAWSPAGSRLASRSVSHWSSVSRPVSFSTCQASTTAGLLPTFGSRPRRGVGAASNGARSRAGTPRSCGSRPASCSSERTRGDRARSDLHSG